MKYQIAEARKLRNITQAELAEKMRTTQQTIQRYETNQVNIRMDKMIEMSEILNVSLAYLLGMSSKPELSEASDMAPVPLLSSISADTPIEMINVEETYDIPSEIHDKYPQAFLLKVVDDSMNRVLPNGCYALINPCKEAIEPMKAYAVCVDDFDALTRMLRNFSKCLSVLTKRKILITGLILERNYKLNLYLNRTSLSNFFSTFMNQESLLQLLWVL